MRAWQVVLGAALVVVAVVSFKISRTVTSSKEIEPEATPVQEKNSVPSASPAVETQRPLVTKPGEIKSSAPLAGDVRPVIEQMPKAMDVREEVKENPHATPVSVVLFSAMLAERLETSLQNPEQAPKFFAELRECVTAKSESTVNSVQALCLLNAKRLGAKVTSLAGDLHQLEQAANPKIVQLLQILEN